MPEFLFPKEPDCSNQNSQPGEFNELWASGICSDSACIMAESGDTHHLSLLDQLPPFLWARCSTDTGRIHSIPPIKIQQTPQNLSPEVINAL